ncbi:MAG TPA: PLP-dependent aminotransferase family protein [Solirubrobacteraceae bacterium]|jgi:DNA-binding transcriptional MocR family regulator|nr:PLP-dependent aminotransferase family protein [Solirubrobacteraceae bacterium]
MIDGSSIDRVTAVLRERAQALSAGARMPSTRELTAQLAVSPVTLSRALAALAGEGVLVTRPGSGTYVAERGPAADPLEDLSWQTLALGDRTVDASSVAFLLRGAEPGQLSLTGGYPNSSLLPGRALALAIARAARRPDAAERPPVAGIAPLREWFARQVAGTVSADDVLITAGGQSALSAAFRAIAPSGSSVLVESPTYIGAIAVARAARLNVIPVPTDEHGVRPDVLAETLALTGARLFYCQPTYQNPTGTILAPDRRQAVLEVARDAGAFVIEDDYARWLGHGATAPPPLISEDSDGRVIYIGSLTKVLSPNMRVGALIARGPVAERIRAHRVVDDFFVSRTLQEAALELLTAPAWRTHLTRLAAALSERRTALLRALATTAPDLHLGVAPSGGLHLWVRLPDGIDDVALAEHARAAGVLVSPGRPYHPAEPPAPHLRLSYAAAANTRELATAVQRLATAQRA